MPDAALVHDSIHPTRGGMPGEAAFLTAWQEIMDRCAGDDEEPCPLDGVHSARWSRRPAIDQADATMAATLVQWLGTNAGACLIHQARALQRSGLSGPEAFVAAWAIRNARRRATNSDLRSIESMMIPPGEPRNLDGDPHRAPEITLRQYETAEHVCAWLGSPEGQGFIAAREREIEAYDAHERLRMREANRTGTTPPRGMGAEAVADYFRVLRKAIAGSEQARGAA